jgi:hypothetical protein
MQKKGPKPYSIVITGRERRLPTENKGDIRKITIKISRRVVTITVSKITHKPQQPINVDFSTHLYKLMSISRQRTVLTVHPGARQFVQPADLNTWDSTN